MRYIGLAVISLTLALANPACSADGDSSTDSADGDSSTGSTDGNDGGGNDTGTPPPEGAAIEIKVIEHLIEIPVSSATVVVEGASGAQVVTQTDAQGYATVADAKLDHPLTVHVFSAEHRYVSRIGTTIDTLNVTLKRRGEPILPDAATVSGHVVGLEDIDAEEGMPRAAVVLGIKSGKNPYFLDQPKRPDQVTSQNVMIMDDDIHLDDFKYTYLPSEYWGLAVAAGPNTPLEDGSVGPWDITHMGFLPDLSLESGMTLDNVDIELSHPLNQDVSVSVTGVPDLWTIQLSSRIIFPNGASTTVVGYKAMKTNPMNVKMPTLNGALEGASYLFHISAESPPNKFSNNELISDDGKTAQINGLMMPPSEIAAQGRSFYFTPAPDASYHFARINREENDWIIYFLNGTTGEYTLPEVPEPHLDRGDSPAKLHITAWRVKNVDVSNSSNKDIMANRTAFSGDMAGVTFGE